MERLDRKIAEKQWIASFAPATVVCEPSTWILIKELTMRHTHDTNEQPWTPFDNDKCPVRERSDGALEIEMTAHLLWLLWFDVRPWSPPESFWSNHVRPGLDVETIEAFVACVHAQLAERLLPVGRRQPDQASAIVIDM